MLWDHENRDISKREAQTGFAEMLELDFKERERFMNGKKEGDLQPELIKNCK